MLGMVILLIAGRCHETFITRGLHNLRREQGVLAVEDEKADGFQETVQLNIIS